MQDVDGGRGSNVVGIVHGSRANASTHPFVMVSAHFDSVPSGPGATDDGVGAAVVVEAFRVFVENLKTQRPVCDVLFVLVDGEEVSLRGSSHFMKTTYGRRARVVINLEGSGAPSSEYLIRTNSPWIASLYARHAPHPAAYSITEILFTIFGRGQTDAQEYRRNGAHVVDLVFVENRFVYHTQDDSIDSVALGSLQHEGDNILSLLRSASSAGLPDAFAYVGYGSAIFSGSLYFTVLRSIVWCSSRLTFQLVAGFFTIVALISLVKNCKARFRALLQEANRVTIGILSGMLLQAIAAVVFVQSRDVTSWYWSANTIRVLHPAVWLLLIVSLMHKCRPSEADDVCKGCLFVAVVLNLILIVYIPELACASIWVLLPAVVPAISLLLHRLSDWFQHDPDRAHMGTEMQSSICFLFAVIGLLLALDNVLSWIPPFLYYLDAMRSPAVVAEISKHNNRNIIVVL